MNKTIQYFSKDDSTNVMFVGNETYYTNQEAVPDDHILFFVLSPTVRATVVLNVVQVNKLCQQLHEWLHERANRPDRKNWVEL